MGFFGKPKNPEEKFEDLVRKAAKDPGQRPYFYREFLNANLYFIGNSIGGYAGDQPVARENQPIEYHYTETAGKIRLSVFSSLKYLQATISGEVHYLRMNATQLLQMIRRDAGVYLNPGADCGKDFTPEEIRSLLDGTLFRELKRIELSKAAMLLLGQPAQPPLKLLEALKSYFYENGYAQKLYLGQYFDPRGNEGPQCVVGILLSHSAGVNLSAILPSLGMIAHDTLEQGKSVDFIDIADGGTIANYLVKDTKPFFERDNKAASE